MTLDEKQSPPLVSVPSSVLLCPVAVLYARQDSIYKQLPGVDVWDAERDARNFAGKEPVVAHPPCRAWGRLRWVAKPRHDEKDLARHAVRIVRSNGGVLEHPASSTLWLDQNLPKPGEKDQYGGWTLAVPQMWWGHRAQKNTVLYIVGCTGKELPPIPYKLGEPECWVGRWGPAMQARRPNTKPRPPLRKSEHESTPRAFAEWLVAVARICGHNR